MDKQEAVRQLQTGRERLLAALSRYSDAEMETHPVSGEWTGKDVLAHVTRWEDTCSSYLGEIAAGRPISLLPGTSSELNAGYYAQDRNISLAQARQNSDASFTRALTAVEGLSDEQLNAEMRGPWPEISEVLPLWRIIAVDTWEHYVMHLKDFGG